MHGSHCRIVVFFPIKKVFLSRIFISFDTAYSTNPRRVLAATANVAGVDRRVANIDAVITRRLCGAIFQNSGWVKFSLCLFP